MFIKISHLSQVQEITIIKTKQINLAARNTISLKMEEEAKDKVKIM
jgi:hypothetical protein